MKTSEQIDLITKTRYNNYQGSLMQRLKSIHQSMRTSLGDEQYLTFLKELERNLPTIPKYEIPEHAKSA